LARRYFYLLSLAAIMQHIYCISGLGADFRIFQHIHIPGALLHPIQWEMPEPGESLPSFAMRLSKQIQHPDAILMGVSYGGMLATEISKQIPVKKIIIISSNRSPNEFPRYLKMAGRLRLHKLVPYQLVTRFSGLNRFIFDTRSKAEELYLKRMMLKDSDILFMKRSVNMIMQWKEDHREVTNLLQIHGKKDRLLLPGRIQPDYWIEDAGHFMIWNAAEKISEIIHREIQSLIP
jgi:pimeloyl-ACP methyl ester carboxylesterase